MWKWGRIKKWDQAVNWEQDKIRWRFVFSFERNTLIHLLRSLSVCYNGPILVENVGLEFVLERKPMRQFRMENWWQKLPPWSVLKILWSKGCKIYRNSETKWERKRKVNDGLETWRKKELTHELAMMKLSPSHSSPLPQCPSSGKGGDCFQKEKRSSAWICWFGVLLSILVKVSSCLLDAVPGFQEQR